MDSPSDSHRAYIGLGANLGKPEAQIESAIDALAQLESTRLVARSRFYRSPAWGVVTQPAFVNAVVLIDTAVEAQALMAHLLDIELAAGRRRTQRWGPRLIDLDLLLYGQQIIDEPGLRVPHPLLQERAFVLVPLAEISPHLQVPGWGAVGALLKQVDCVGVEAIG